MDDHIYDDPDNDVFFAKPSYPIKTESPHARKGQEKKKKNKKKGLSILKSFKKNKKGKQDCEDSPKALGQSEKCSGGRLGKANDSMGRGHALSSTSDSISNYYIKDGQWVAKIANKQTPTLKQSASPTLIKTRKTDVAHHDASPSPPPPLPNRQYLLDTAFLAELEGPTTEATPTSNPPEYYEDTAPHSNDAYYEDTAPHSGDAYYEDTAPHSGDAYYKDTAPHSGDAYYEDIDYNSKYHASGYIEEDADSMESYVDVTRDAVDSDDSDEYIEADQLAGESNDYYVNVDREGVCQSDYESDSDDYVQADVD